MHKMFQTENLKVSDHLRDLGVDGRIILQQILKRQDCEGANWIHVA
jgi:hypothetical protein